MGFRSNPLMYGDPKDIIINFIAGHGIRDAMMFPAEFGSSWTQGSSDMQAASIGQPTWTKTSWLQAVGFSPGAQGPPYYIFLHGPAHRLFPMVSRLIMGPYAMRPSYAPIPF